MRVLCFNLRGTMNMLVVFKYLTTCSHAYLIEFMLCIAAKRIPANLKKISLHANVFMLIVCQSFESN